MPPTLFKAGVVSARPYALVLLLAGRRTERLARNRVASKRALYEAALAGGRWRSTMKAPADTSIAPIDSTAKKGTTLP